MTTPIFSHPTYDVIRHNGCVGRGQTYLIKYKEWNTDKVSEMVITSERKGYVVMFFNRLSRKYGYTIMSIDKISDCSKSRFYIKTK